MALSWLVFGSYFLAQSIKNLLNWSLKIQSWREDQTSKRGFKFLSHILSHLPSRQKILQAAGIFFLRHTVVKYFDIGGKMLNMSESYEGFFGSGKMTAKFFFLPSLFGSEKNFKDEKKIFLCKANLRVTLFLSFKAFLHEPRVPVL